MNAATTRDGEQAKADVKQLLEDDLIAEFLNLVGYSLHFITYYGVTNAPQYPPPAKDE
jgi:hypothetical protein